MMQRLFFSPRLSTSPQFPFLLNNSIVSTDWHLFHTNSEWIVVIEKRF